MVDEMFYKYQNEILKLKKELYYSQYDWAIDTYTNKVLSMLKNYRAFDDIEGLIELYSIAFD